MSLRNCRLQNPPESKEDVVRLSKNARKGDWVRVYSVVLEAHRRSLTLPDDTKAIPYESWVNGFVETDASIGDIVTIVTISGRKVKGKLVEVNPRYHHDFGDIIPELLTIGLELRRFLSE